MSENWYLTAFGVELGPMTWDDLRQRASRGDLRPNSQVRQGETGAFIQAGDVPGLFGRASDSPGAPTWFCEVLGSELGPMSWKELCLLGERGTLRRDARVRCEQGAWVVASSMAGLVPSSAAAPPDSTAPSAVAAAPPTKVLGPTVVLEPSAEVSEPVANAPGSRPPPSELPRAEQTMDEKRVPAAPVPVAHAPTAPPPMATTPNPRKDKKPAGPAVSRARIRLPVKPLAALAGAGLIVCGVYFGWTYWPAGAATPDHQKVAALYRQAYEQIKQFRSNPQNQSPAGLQFRFSRTVAALRKQLEQSAGDSSAGRLADAGTQLSQMLADCQAANGSAEATRFTETEQRFLANLNSFQNGQP